MYVLAINKTLIIIMDKYFELTVCPTLLKIIHKNKYNLFTIINLKQWNIKYVAGRYLCKT